MKEYIKPEVMVVEVKQTQMIATSQIEAPVYIYDNEITDEQWGFSVHFFFGGKEETEPKKKPKTSWLGGRLIDSWNHKMELATLRHHFILIDFKNLSVSEDLLVRNVLLF